ncbi:MAG: hypothetical protein WCE81_06845 [Halobacteriota archaeon]
MVLKFECPNNCCTRRRSRPDLTRWTWWRSGSNDYDCGFEQRKDRINIVAISEGVQLRYTVTVDGKASPYDYAVPIVWVPCNYGGKRPYFIDLGVKNNVPCHRRVAKLYKPPASHYFLCRHCPHAHTNEIQPKIMT